LARTEKSIVSCSLNGLSAIYNKTFTELFEDKALSARIELLFDECYNILSANLPLGDRLALKVRLFRDWRYTEHYSSMWQDVNDSKTTEIDFLNGYLIELGKKHGIPSTENQKIVSELNTVVSKHQLI
jgi:2-dehydropantoate 2-reductase